MKTKMLLSIVGILFMCIGGMLEQLSYGDVSYLSPPPGETPNLAPVKFISGNSPKKFYFVTSDGFVKDETFHSVTSVSTGITSFVIAPDDSPWLFVFNRGDDPLVLGAVRGSSPLDIKILPPIMGLSPNKADKFKVFGNKDKIYLGITNGTNRKLCSLNSGDYGKIVAQDNESPDNHFTSQDEQALQRVKAKVSAVSCVSASDNGAILFGTSDGRLGSYNLSFVTTTYYNYSLEFASNGLSDSERIYTITVMPKPFTRDMVFNKGYNGLLFKVKCDNAPQYKLFNRDTKGRRALLAASCGHTAAAFSVLCSAGIWI